MTAIFTLIILGMVVYIIWWHIMLAKAEADERHDPTDW